MALYWTRTTLAEQLLGEINIARNAATGIPDRLAAIVEQSFAELWEADDWRFRVRSADITVEAGTGELPSDFDRFDSRQLVPDPADTDMTDAPLVNLETNREAFEAYLNVHDSTEDWPQLAIAVPDDTATLGASPTYATLLLTAPPGDGSYHGAYLCTAPTLGLTDVPQWPQAFHRGWQYLATARAWRAFHPTSGEWQESWAAYEAWAKKAKEKNDEQLRSATPALRDDNMDAGHLASRWWTL